MTTQMREELRQKIAAILLRNEGREAAERFKKGCGK